MKTKRNNELSFKSKDIIELQTEHEYNVIGGTLSSFPTAGPLEDWIIDKAKDILTIQN